MRYIRIPMERVGVLIGPEGEIKKKIEQITKIKLCINSESGEITFNEQELSDPFKMFIIENIIRAIGRGFSPENAFLLLNEDMDLFIFDIHDYVGKRPTHVQRLKSRVIGSEGKTKRVLEELTESKISIYGHTIAIIGSIFNIDITKKAVDKLLSGSKHATVYRFVEGSMKKLRLEGGF
ncbi:MAG: KH domain-containing protein [Candidatus Thermoplasmatota archaeon]|nr:KH domain-containing protein [Candidatus Thermoplasmatota archaeon]